MDRKVYVLGDGGHDYSDAERFGKLVFLNIPRHMKWDIAQLYEALQEGLSEAEPNDLLIVSHLASHCCVATALLVEWFGRVNFLIYRKDRYEEHKLVVNADVTIDH
jgi:hypothetical protein